ncbi:MAG: T9SS type A sorting domain-containing protein [Candidatus Eisenbacteria bacterium]|uniref:T9SS type A sorting domain-containing protein n=1 Tax=Eiseniibacteriota bacterium TaxID=2212470 RepID=A0A933S9K5_UNCEI|nr:T9SS type A sorting domain-containing protein [Candidatus Eisenbacteria bacterium]
MRRLLPALTVALLAGAASVACAAGPRAAALEARATSGALYDRVLPLARLDQLDGSAAAPAVTTARFRQAVDEWTRASLVPPVRGGIAALDAAARAGRAAREVPLAFLDASFDRVQPGAALSESAPLTRARTFACAPLVPRTWHGDDVRFRFDASAWFGDGPAPARLEFDADDGAGWRAIGAGSTVHVRYSAPGTRVLRARTTRTDGTTAEARAVFEVAALAAPAPDDTLAITANVPYQGQFGTGSAYVYRASGHATLLNPVVVVEGFDTDNTMGWDELYALLDQQGLIETLRADGFDCVVLDFTDATDAIQKNAYVVAALVGRVRDEMPTGATMAVVGASMGGLCSRYALAWMEQQQIPHSVRTWISFDSPHGGADIPLGLQYWIDFFSSQSTGAADFRAILQRPAARQMLLHHFTTPATTSGTPDPLRATLLSDFAAVGGWPALPRLVSVANGSANGTTQGFAPGAQLIRYEFNNLVTAITGNVWAVPNVTSTTIFRGSIRILFSTTSQTVTVSNTQPWDGAPGGSRASMAELDTTAVPYGDIVALHPSHCFIPTVSAIALDTTNPFFDVAGTPGLAGLTPFDAVYVPSANQEHVLITPENAVWVRNELWQGVLDAAPGTAAAQLALAAPAPNPSRGGVTLTFTLPRAGRADLRVYDVSGREIATLARGARAAGLHEARWDGRDARGVPSPGGVYFARLVTDSGALTRRVLRLP